LGNIIGDDDDNLIKNPGQQSLTCSAVDIKTSERFLFKRYRSISRSHIERELSEEVLVALLQIRWFAFLTYRCP
jgi:hypothetical protein